MFDYTYFIEYLLQSLQKKYKKYDEYILCQSPINDDKNPSAQFFKDGFCKVYNASVAGENIFSIKEVSKLVGMFDEYLQWLMQYYSIPSYKLNKLRMIARDEFKQRETWDLLKEFAVLKKEHYISQDELTNGDYVRLKTVKCKPCAVDKKPTLTEVTFNNDELDTINKYAESRGLELNKYNVFPCKITNGIYDNLCLKIKYTDDIIKYRLINNAKLRYLTSGAITELFWVSEGQSDTLLLIEGAIEAIMAHKANLKYDVAGIDSCSKICTNRNLAQYKNVIVLLDADKFETSVPILKKYMNQFPTNVIYAKKIDFDDKMDFNDYFMKNSTEFANYLQKI